MLTGGPENRAESKDSSPPTTSRRFPQAPPPPPPLLCPCPLCPPPLHTTPRLLRGLLSRTTKAPRLITTRKRPCISHLTPPLPPSKHPNQLPFSRSPRRRISSESWAARWQTRLRAVSVLVLVSDIHQIGLCGNGEADRVPQVPPLAVVSSTPSSECSSSVLLLYIFYICSR